MVDRSWSNHGFVHWPTSQDIYYELLPIHWCAIGRDGISRTEGRGRFRYDGPGLKDFRLETSPYGPRNQGLWPIRYDPRNVLFMYFQNPNDGSWHELRWKHATRFDRPMDDRFVADAANRFFEQHQRNASEQELADTTLYLLDVIHEQAAAAQAEDGTVAARLEALGQVAADDRGEDAAPSDSEDSQAAMADEPGGDFDFSDDELADLEVGS